MIPYAGIEGDEAFFSWPMYSLFNRSYGITVFHKHVTLMVYPYAGSLKTLLYWPVLKAFGPNVWSVRLPAVIIGALTILVFIRWVQQIAGTRPALIAGLLLATDPSFILTDTFDWGPVAIEHLLLVTGCVLFTSRRSALGSFCFGLALWNKAVFVWALSGLTAGMLIAWLPEVRRFAADKRQVARCLLAFALGAIPLVIYNVHTRNATAHANIHPSFEGFEAKIESLRSTLNGADLFGIIASPDSEGAPKAPRSFDGRFSWAIARRLGRHEHSLFIYGILFALLSSPLWWRSNARRAALFAIVYSAVTFLTMASIRYTGGAHHVVLLYPMPQLLVGIAVTALRPPRLAWVIGTVLVLANLLVVNQYLVQLAGYGAYGLFTDALNPLSESLSDAAGDTVYALDYGIGDSLNLLHWGRLNMKREWVIPQMQSNEIQAIVADPKGIFVDRVADREYYKGTAERLSSAAREAGYRRDVLRTITDSNGKAQFEVFRFVRMEAVLALPTTVPPGRDSTR